MENFILPKKIELGTPMMSTVGQALFKYNKFLSGSEPILEGYRYVMGYPLPSWQRGLVWNEEKDIKFIESLWVGVDVGTYTFVETVEIHEFDGLLIDGQQRMNALERFVNDEFRIFKDHDKRENPTGISFSEFTDSDKRRFDSVCSFRSYKLTYDHKKDNENRLIDYYNRMNFSGVSHKENDYVPQKKFGM